MDTVEAARGSGGGRGGSRGGSRGGNGGGGRGGRNGREAGFGDNLERFARNAEAVEAEA